MIGRCLAEDGSVTLMRRLNRGLTLQSFDASTSLIRDDQSLLL